MRIRFDGALDLRKYGIELHRLPRKERNMTWHQNPGPDDNGFDIWQISLVLSQNIRCLV